MFVSSILVGSIVICCLVVLSIVIDCEVVELDLVPDPALQARLDDALGRRLERVARPGGASDVLHSPPRTIGVVRVAWFIATRPRRRCGDVEEAGVRSRRRSSISRAQTSVLQRRDADQHLALADQVAVVDDRPGDDAGRARLRPSSAAAVGAGVVQPDQPSRPPPCRWSGPGRARARRRPSASGIEPNQTSLRASNAVRKPPPSIVCVADVTRYRPPNWSPRPVERR